MKQSLFITAEGTDGSGKTTQIGIMTDYLKQKGHNVLLTREPGGTKISEKVRAILLDPNNAEMDIMAEVLLYAAARAQLVHEVIKPSLKKGITVICDRFADSSYAYQGFGRGVPLGTLEYINNAALNGLNPDITFFFDLNPEIALRRRLDTSDADRIEREKIEFHMKVYRGYKELAALHPGRIKAINSSMGIDEVAGQVRAYIDQILTTEY